MKETYIYFVQAGDGGPIKIGFTAGQPRLRLSKMQTDCPVRLNILGAIIGDETREKKLHTLLAKHRLHGEWFTPADEVLDLIKDQLLGGSAWKAAPFERKPKTNHPLAIYRAEKNISLAEMAALVGSSAGQLSRLEKGKSKGGIALNIRIALATGISGAALRPDIAKIMRDAA